MRNLAFIDIEATSADAINAEIIEIAFVIKDHEGNLVDHYNGLINPGRRIPENIVELTGITDKMVENAPEFHEVADTIYNKLKNTVLVAHKAEFDYQILKTKFVQLEKDFSSKSVCTLQQAQRTIPGMSSYSLASLCQFFGISLKKNHRALDDAEAVAELYENLALLETKHTTIHRYLSRHKKIIDKSRKIPGVLSFKDNNGKVFLENAVDNVQKELTDRLVLNSTNKALITKCFKVEVLECASFAKAMLIASRRQGRPRWSIYSFKDKYGEIIVKCGKTQPNKDALLYFHSKTKALKTLSKLKGSAPKKKYIYQEGPVKDKNEIFKKNANLQEELRKLKPSIENTLIRSHNKLNGMYQYVLINNQNRYATFESVEQIKASEHIPMDGVNFKKLRPSSRRALELSLQYIKHQKTKTDVVLKLKQLS
ncbi:MAG: 3'-5' exonuclease [Bacteriovoracaceae bacterium]|nr:3'-5' exonuclease [Bacteriovoracaceae bacterium]